MGVLNPNSTSYVHPDEPNLLNIHKAMTYNSLGEPILRVQLTGGSGSDYVLPPATTSTLGGVIIGDNISVDENGRISVVPCPDNIDGGSAISSYKIQELADGGAATE